jgi:hypothetical protein
MSELIDHLPLHLAAAVFVLQVAAPKPPATPVTPDPASSQFTADAGLLMVIVKPTAIAEYELAIRTLQQAMSEATDPERSAAAKGWRVFKATEKDAKGNAVYVHAMLPAVPGFDYRPSLLLDEMVKELEADLLSKYADAFAGPPTKLNLTEFANMSIAPAPLPLPKPDPAAPIKKPGSP